MERKLARPLGRASDAPSRSAVAFPLGVLLCASFVPTSHLPPTLTAFSPRAALEQVGKDGVKLVPYSPIAGALGYPNMGEFGPGVHGWYVVAGGFGVNVTMTLPTEPGQPGPFMMNAIVAAPPMCTSSATGLCKTDAHTTDTLLQSYAANYFERLTNIHHAANTNTMSAAKGEQQLALNEPELKTYPALDEANTLAGLKLLSCPA